MAKRKQNQKQLKQQEETLVDIVEARDQAQDFLEKYQNYILITLGAVALLFGGILAYNNLYKAPKQKEAVEQMHQAEFQFQRDSFILALTNPGGGYSGFLDIIENYGGTPAANTAHYYAGVCYLNLGQYEAAISYLEDFSPRGKLLPMMKFGALGDAYAELNEFDKALSFYKKAAAAEDNATLTPYFLRKVAMLHEKQGNKKESLKVYTQLKEEYFNSAYGKEAEKYIERLNSEN